MSEFETQYLTSAWDQLAHTHGITATYKSLNAGSGTAITVVFQQESIDVMDFGDGQEQVQMATILCDPGDVTSPHVDDTFTISSVVWAVKSFRMDSPVIRCECVRYVRKNYGGANTRSTR